MLSQFYSDEYARIVAMVDTEVEGDRAFGLVEQINAAAASRYDECYTAGQSANLYDMANIVAVDNVVVSLVAVIAIFIVLLVTFKSASLPFILLLAIESGIWINLSIPYFTGTPLNFIGYLVVNTVQLGATIDYGILLTTHYLRERQTSPRARRRAPHWESRSGRCSSPLAYWRRQVSRLRSPPRLKPSRASAFFWDVGRCCRSPW